MMNIFSHRIKIYDMNISLLTEMEIELHVKMYNMNTCINFSQNKDIRHAYMSSHRNGNIIICKYIQRECMC